VPYIDQKQREKYDEILEAFFQVEIETKGDLEYCIFSLMKRYMDTRKTRYSTLHDCAYAAQHCADEFRRRFLDKREDEAIKKNGDVE